MLVLLFVKHSGLLFVVHGWSFIMLVVNVFRECCFWGLWVFDFCLCEGGVDVRKVEV